MISSVPQRAPKWPACHATSCFQPPGTDRCPLAASQLPPSKMLERESRSGRLLGEQNWLEGGQHACETG
eukprot:10994731-Alexandrium_andersonii.AAC.1